MNYATVGILTTSTSKEIYRSAFERKTGERCQSSHKPGVWGTLEVFPSEKELLAAWAKIQAQHALRKRAIENAKRKQRRADYLEGCRMLAAALASSPGSLFTEKEAYDILASY